jgi:hypothetical protein
MSRRYCVDCAFHRTGYWMVHACTFWVESTKRNPVDGKERGCESCHVARASADLCGIEGHHWQRRPSLRGRISARLWKWLNP